MEYLFFSASLLAYVLVALDRVALGDRRPEWLSRGASAGLVFGVGFHLLGLARLSLRLGQLPFHTPGASLILLAVIVAAGSLVLRGRQLESLSGLLAGLGAVLLGLGMVLPNPIEPMALSTPSLWFPIHAVSIFLGMSSFALAFAISALYLVVRRRLKQKRLDALRRLPSLDQLDGLNTRFIALGFLALTVGIAAGGLWAASAHEHTADLGPALYASVVLWGWYAAAILVRVVGGWRGRTAAHFSVVGFVGLVVGIATILLISKGWH